MQAPPRVIFIGLDAGDVDLIERWSNEGALPNLRALRRTAASAITSLPPRLYSGAVWPSLFTGVTPAKHGSYHHVKLEADYEITGHRRWSSREPFWNQLSLLNRRVAIIDVPYAPLSDGLNGMQIVDWTSHDPEFTEIHRHRSISSIRTYPPALAAEVVDLFGKDEVGLCEQPGRDVDEFRDFRDRVVARIEKKAALCLHYLERERWDLFLTVFADPHCIGHQCWQIHDPSHPWHDPDVARALGDPIKDIYVALDAAIGRILERAGPETAAFVFASHGMAPIHDGNFLLDHILHGFEGGGRHRALSAMSVLNQVWEKLPGSLRTLLRPVRNRWKGRAREALLRPARRSGRCFMLPTGDNCGGIRVNLVGREPNGRVRPGEEYRTFCASLTRDLLALTDPKTGERLIEGVYRYEELFPAVDSAYNADLYNGNYLGDLPDLLVVWNRPNITSVHSPIFGTIAQVYQGSRAADHGHKGVLFVRAPAVEPGAFAHEISVLDFAPTMAAALGVVLDDVDGTPIAAFGADRSAPGNVAPAVKRSGRT